MEEFTVFSKLLNPTNEKETKDICNLISDAMKVRQPVGLIVCHRRMAVWI